MKFDIGLDVLAQFLPSHPPPPPPPIHTHTKVNTFYPFPLQLVNIGSHYMYSNEDQSEFLVVVSQEIGEQFRSYKPTNKEMVILHFALVYCHWYISIVTDWLQALKQHGSRMWCWLD